MYKRTSIINTSGKKMPYETILKIKDNLVRSSKSITNEELPFRKTMNGFVRK